MLGHHRAFAGERGFQQAQAAGAQQARSRRASAATASPSASTSRSPRTRLAAGTRSNWPPRRTLAVAALSCASAATAWSARACCHTPMPVLSTSTAAITRLSTGTPAAPCSHHTPSDTAAAPASSSDSGSASGASARRQAAGAAAACSWLGPSAARRCPASAAGKPWLLSQPSCCATAAPSCRLGSSPVGGVARKDGECTLRL